MKIVKSLTFYRQKLRPEEHSQLALEGWDWTLNSVQIPDPLILDAQVYKNITEKSVKDGLREGE